MKKFEELTEREVLALAIALEEEDERVYADFAEGLRPGLSRDGFNVRRHARRRVRTPPPVARTLPARNSANIFR